MLALILFPTDWQIKLNSIEKQFDRVAISVQTTTATSTCPACHTHAHRVHGHYSRHPIDLPICGCSVELNISVRRFCCDNRKCRRATFAESLQQILNRYARRTHRLITQQHHVAFELGGRAGERLLAKLSMDTSRDTLINMIRHTPELDYQTPRVLGVDDWAFRKGKSYGTVLVDLETHQVIDLLPERNAKSLALWLEKHPGVEIISRDRGKEYIKGATDGAPKAVQVADRWHLMKNLREAYGRVFETKPHCLKAAADPTPIEQTAPSNSLDSEGEENKMTVENNPVTVCPPFSSPQSQSVNNSKDSMREVLPFGWEEEPHAPPTRRVSSSGLSIENSSSVSLDATIPSGDHSSKADCQLTSAENHAPSLSKNPPTTGCQLTVGDESSDVPQMGCSDEQLTNVTQTSADSCQTTPSPLKQQRFLAVKKLAKLGLLSAKFPGV